MTQALTAISGRDLINRILVGERDFTGTVISAADGALDQESKYQDLIEYLKTQDLRASPVIADGADWRGLRARGLFCRAAKLAGADLSGAELSGAELSGCDLTGANLSGADIHGAFFTHQRLMNANLSNVRASGLDLYEANLMGVNFSGADLSGAIMPRTNLRKIDWTGTRLTGADFYRADIRGAIGLETAQDLGTVRYHQTVVTEREREVITVALRARPLFDLRSEQEEERSHAERH